ncbi:MAG: hypothetical protein RI885_1322 [Actinomycetota bacterium]|jgi:PKD repeat protein
MGFTNPRGRRALSAAIVVALSTGSLLSIAQPAAADTAPADPATPSTVSADALPTVQINGVVWDQEIVGNTVYAVGEFTTAQPAGAAAGTSTVPRSNMLAYNLTTGALISGFAPTFNGRINSVDATPDGSKVFVGGLFTQVNGSTRNRVAGFTVATGALLPGFAPSANSAVDAIEVTDTTAYFGGNFTAVGSTPRLRAAAVTISNGALLPFAPAAEGGRVRGIVVSPDQSKLVLAGSFTTLNGSNRPGYGMGAVAAGDGSSLPWAANDLIRDAGEGASIYGLTSDGDSVYGVGYDFYGGGNLEGAFRADWSDGAIEWVQSCHGDTYSIAARGDTIYTAGHSYYCGNNGGFPATEPRTFQRGLAWSKDSNGRVNGADPYGYYNYAGVPSPELLSWWPDINTGSYTGANQGPWSVVANDDYVLYAGEFTIVNNKRQQGLVRFANRAAAPNKEGPRLSGANFVPTAVSLASGTVRLSWPANYDRDNQNLTYDLIRDNAQGSPIYSTVEGSRVWFDRPTMGFTDRGLVPGQTYTYRLRATDPLGNTVLGSQISVVASSEGAFSTYAAAVIDDGAKSFWRMGESTGSTVYDWAGFADGVAAAGVTRGASGALDGDPNRASTFSGAADGFVATRSAIKAPDTFAVEAWFKTTSTSGGKIVGFGNRSSGNSSSYDRHVFMDDAGRVIFGVYPNEIRTVQSATGYNDGQWHQVVANLGPSGMQLFIDGARVAQRTDTTAGQAYDGYWRIGGDSSWAANDYFSGSIDDVAVYGAPLSSQTVDDHLVASGRQSVLPVSPSDAYGAAVFSAAPDIYWRLGESTGTVAADATLGDSGIYFGGVTKPVAGAVAGTSDTAAAFDGVDGLVSSSRQYSNPQVFSVELWFESTTTSGGKLIGFGRQQTGNSSSYDRHVYLDDSGRLVFGVYNGALNTITTVDRYNDGRWHHVVGTLSGDGLRLYVDGELAGSHPATDAERYDGFWRVGGDTTWGSTSRHVDARIDEVAIYSTAVSASTVASHHRTGRGVVANVAPRAQFTSVTSDLDLTTDASASTDTDGSIVRYSWDFGDGATASGASAGHTYTQAGSYTVTLTVTDDDGATDTTARVVTVVAPNVAPAAEFSVEVSNLSAVFDGSASRDPDGLVTAYSWDFGDGASASGSTTTHAYAAAGSYTARLTVTDNAGAATTVSREVVTTEVPNAAPVSSFVATSTGLSASLDASASVDPDGTIVSWTWTFGDSTTGSGRTTTHAYAAAGSFTVGLTVTDDRGAVTTSSRAITVSAPAAGGPFASDTFARTITGGLGTAELGGPWAVTGSTGSFAVGGGVATLRSSAPGTNLAATLPSVSSTDTDIAVTTALRQATSGSGVYIGLVGRRTGSSEYRARAVIAPSGSVVLQVQRDSTTLQALVVPGITHATGDQLRLRFQAVGTSPTTLRAKIWRAGAAEPTGWQITRTDATPALQQAGSVGVSTYLAGNATVVPLTVAFDDVVAGSSTAPVVVPPANAPPVASFTSTETSLATAVDAAASSDPDGFITSYAWNFGDGGTASGPSTSHAYATAGTYAVQLTVTDNGGAMSTTTRQVTVATPIVVPPGTPPPLATDNFERTVSGGLGTASLGGSWTPSGAASSYGVSGGQARFTSAAAGATTAAYLTSATSSSSDTTVTVSLDKAATGSGSYVSVVGRRIGGDEYRARLVFASSGTVALQAQRGATTLVATLAPGLTYVPGEQLRVRVQVTGVSPTTIRAKVWRVGTVEPAAWLVSTTDSTAALQAAGQVGLGSYLSGSANSAPVVTSFDDLSVTSAG